MPLTGVHSDIGGSVDVRLRLGLEATVVVLSHDDSSWSQAEKRLYSPQSGASQVQWLWAKRQLLRLQKLILYLNTRILYQAILRKSQ